MNHYRLQVWAPGVSFAMASIEFAAVDLHDAMYQVTLLLDRQPPDFDWPKVIVEQIRAPAERKAA